VDCLSTYFEISGHIVECEDELTSLLSPYSKVSAAERPERGRTSARSQVSLIPQTSSKASSKRSRSDKRKEGAAYIGAAAIRVGVAILWVPDPIPFVDEVIGAALIGAGTGLVLYSES